MKFFVSAGLACIAMLWSGLASAEVVKGTNVLEVTAQTVTDLPGGGTATQVVQIGPATAATEDDIFAGGTFHCVGTTIADAEGAQSRNRGHCLTTHANGEVTWLWFDGPNANEGNWGFLDGTGVYSGIEGTGTFKNDDAGAGSYEGTWQIAAE